MSPATARLPIAESFLIQQDWSVYTPEQHAVWAELVSRRMPQLKEHACKEYLDGFDQIGLREDAIPNLTEVNKRLGPRTGWNATPVSGFLPPDAFFEMLAARQFPTTTWLRYDQPAYTTYDAAFGIAKDQWHVEAYGTNLGNSDASLFTTSGQFIEAQVPLRPRVLGIKAGFKF